MLLVTLALAPTFAWARCQFFQTAGCSPSGKVEDRQNCDATIEPGTSGYCKCSDGREVRKENCDHPRFTCDDACVEPQEYYQCKGWRETAECNAEGPRIQAEDKPCDAMVPGDRSGYCECSEDRHVLINGCWLSRVGAVPSFRCQDVCAAGPSWDTSIKIE